MSQGSRPSIANVVPDLERYRGRKGECLRVVRALVDKYYPLIACGGAGDDTEE